MKLSEVKVGGKAVIVKVAGHGGFRKRIVEMGFIKGKMVEVINKAPLGDPIEYRIMGYNVSLRLNEAQHIEVISVEEAEEIAKQNTHDKLNIISEDTRKDLSIIPVWSSAREYGYDLSLYQGGNEGLVISDFGEKAKRLFDEDKISEGHYIELLNMISYGQERY